MRKCLENDLGYRLFLQLHKELSFFIQEKDEKKVSVLTHMSLGQELG